jgi:hypothetical protein
MTKTDEVEQAEVHTVEAEEEEDSKATRQRVQSLNRQR